MFTQEELTALEAMVKDFKCQVCGNTHIKFDQNPVYRPVYEEETFGEPTRWIKVAIGRCTWCGMVIEFEMEQVMKSYEIMISSKKQ